MRILCFGDSNTWGLKELGVRYDRETRWTTVVGSLLGDEHTIIEDGLCGRTADSLQEEADSPKGFLQKAIVAAYPFDLAIVMLGLGDLRAELKFTTEQITENVAVVVKAMLNHKFEDGKKPQIILASPPHIKPGVEISKSAYIYGLKENAVEKSKEFAALYKKLADELDVYFFDAALHAQAGDFDHRHLDADGHKALAHAFADYIKSNIL